MRRITTIAGTALVAAATASVVAAGGLTAQPSGERNLTFVERWIPSADVVVQVKARSTGAPGTGNIYLFRNDVLDAQGEAKLGVHEARCEYLRATAANIGSRLICDGAYTFKDGAITTATVFTFTAQPKISFVITGGSGVYEGVRGSGVLTYRSGDDNPFADTTIHLLP